MSVWYEENQENMLRVFSTKDPILMLSTVPIGSFSSVASISAPGTYEMLLYNQNASQLGGLTMNNAVLTSTIWAAFAVRPLDFVSRRFRVDNPAGGVNLIFRNNSSAVTTLFLWKVD